MCEMIAFFVLFYFVLILFERKNEFDHQKKKKKKNNNKKKKTCVVMFIPRLRYCTVVSINLNSKGSDHDSVCLFNYFVFNLFVLFSPYNSTNPYTIDKIISGVYNN